MLSLVFCLAMASGCASWKMNKPISWPLGDDKPKTPDKIVAIWTDTVLYKPDKTQERGFGGRLMFYQAKNERPVKVDGSIVVYAFDETNRAPNNPKPDRKYVFTPDQIPAHYSKSKIGHSYSVWLPWDEVGGPQKEISLVVRFEPKGATGLVMGEPARQLLPGATALAGEPSKLPPEGATAGALPAQSEKQAVQQASYNAALPLPAAPEAPARRMTTTTISVPSETANNLLSAGGTVSSGIPNGRAQPPETSHSQWPCPAAPSGGPATLTPQPSTAAAPQTASALRPRSHFSPPRSRAPAGSSAQPAGERAPWKQRLGESPSAPGVPPGSATGSGLPALPPAAASATY